MDSNTLINEAARTIRVEANWYRGFPHQKEYYHAAADALEALREIAIAVGVPVGTVSEMRDGILAKVSRN